MVAKPRTISLKLIGGISKSGAVVGSGPCVTGITQHSVGAARCPALTRHGWPSRLTQCAEMGYYHRDVVLTPGLVGAPHEPLASLLGFGFRLESLVDFLV